MAEGVRPQVAVEAHVDPGVAAAAEVAQQHGDGESHIGGICQERSREALDGQLGGAWERIQASLNEGKRGGRQRRDSQGFFR